MDKLIPPVHLEWMLIPLFCSLTGYSTKAVQRKIEDGKWVEGIMYRRAPDGHITINLQEYYLWVSGMVAHQPSTPSPQRPGTARSLYQR